MAEEGWDYAEGLKQTKTARVCMTCQHFSYATDRHFHTLLTCSLQRRLVSSRRAPDQEMQELDGQAGAGDRLVP